MNRMTFRTAKRLILGVPLFAALAIVNTGCTQALHSTKNAEGPNGIFHRATEHDTSTTEYVVDPPDEIQITAKNIKEIDAVKQVVRADGKISLNLLGEIKVSGLTPKQIQDKLVTIAGKYYNNPDIKVEVIANSKFYMIFGRGAGQQKKVAYTGNDNVVKALAEAGLNEHSWPQQVTVVRPGRDGQSPARAVVDFKHMQETGDMTQNYALKEGDIITLRESPLSSFNFTMTEVLGPVTGTTEASSGVRAAATPGGGY